MKPVLHVGDQHIFSYRVPREKTVPFLYGESPDFTAMPEVFATGFMVGLVEWACLDHLRACLEPGEGSLGIAIDVTHTAPTLPGMTVTVTATVGPLEGTSRRLARLGARRGRSDRRGTARTHGRRLGPVRQEARGQARGLVRPDGMTGTRRSRVDGNR